MKIRTKICCSHCNGSGLVELSSLLERTLRLLRSKKRVTGATLARIDGCKPTAMNNRLTALKKHGLARAEIDGRQTFFEPEETDDA